MQGHRQGMVALNEVAKVHERHEKQLFLHYANLRAFKKKEYRMREKKKSQASEKDELTQIKQAYDLEENATKVRYVFSAEQYQTFREFISLLATFPSEEARNTITETARERAVKRQRRSRRRTFSPGRVSIFGRRSMYM